MSNNKVDDFAAKYIRPFNLVPKRPGAGFSNIPDYPTAPVLT